MKNEINIGLLGFGTVGSGVAKIMQDTNKTCNINSGVVSIKKVLVKDLSKSRDTNYHLMSSRII